MPISSTSGWRDHWLRTLRARGLAPWPLAATGAAFIAALLLSFRARDAGQALFACVLHAAVVANGLLDRKARAATGRGLPDAPSARSGVAVGRLAAVLTLSSVFTLALVAAATSIVETTAPVSRVLAGALTSALWMAALVALLSTLLPRVLDTFVALLVVFAVAVFDGQRWRLATARAQGIAEALWQNLNGEVMLSDSALGPAAVADLVRWASNLALALLAAVLLFRVRQRRESPAAPAPRALPWPLIAVAGLALVSRLLVPAVRDRVEWVSASTSERPPVASQRPTLYNFTADWCAFCRRLERDLFADPDSAIWLTERYVPVRVLDREREDGRNSAEVAALKAKFEVDGFPTLIVVSPDGTVVARQEGYGGNLREVRAMLAGALSSTARR